MAGFRTFATGEVLTAANVNDFLMGQSVMRFADANARTAALGADVVEGMLTYNLDTDQLEVFDGTNFVVAAPEPPAGIGSNVVQTVKTDVFSTTSATFTTVTGLTVTITPTSASSKILLLADVKLSHTNDAGGYIVRLAGGNASEYVGDADGSRIRALVGIENANAAAEPGRLLGQTFVFVDSPATTTATTYSVEIVQTRAGTTFVNRSGFDSDNANFPRGASSITAIEVAA